MHSGRHTRKKTGNAQARVAAGAGFATALLALALGSCSSSPEGQTEDSECEGPRCVDSGRTRPDQNEDAEGQGDTPEDPDQVCTPGTRTCEAPEFAAECAADGAGFVLLPCDAGEVCVAGECTIPSTDECTPGEVIQCSSTTALLICNATGDGGEPRPCPAEQPQCRNGECTDRICDEGERRCRGNEVLACSPDGRTETVEESCEFACSDGACVSACAGNGKTYVGCGFYALDLDNIAEPCVVDSDCGTGRTCGGGVCLPSAASQQFAVTVSNTAAASVDVTIYDGAGAEVARDTVAVDGIVVIPLPRQDVDDSSLSSNSFRVEATAPVTVHQFNPQNNVGAFSNDASLLLPVSSLGTEYLVMGWPTRVSGTLPLKGFVAIVAATEGRTRVTVTSPVASEPGPSGVPAALVPGVASTFELQRGQVLSFTSRVAGADFSGMEVVSDRPVGVFAGSECGNVPIDNEYCDHLEQQMYPVDTWGTSFVAASFARRGTEPDVWRVMAAEDGTVVRTTPPVSGVDGVTLDRGEVVEVVVRESFLVTADRPIQVGQYMVGSAYPGIANGCNRSVTITVGSCGTDADCAVQGPEYRCIDGRCASGAALCAIPTTCNGRSGIGDPAFLLSVPVNQYLSNYVVLTPDGYAEDYLTIVAPRDASVTLDDTVLPFEDAELLGAWALYRPAVAGGVSHRVTATQPVGLSAYGYDCDVSYAYPGGLNLEATR